MRIDGRATTQPRDVKVELNVQRFPEGSVLYHCGGTSILLSASISADTPSWLAEKGGGWLTAEYAMHPRANPERNTRDGRARNVDGRSTEIQRLIGRALRAAVNLQDLDGKTITVDCDVLNADGGTRTAAITGGFIALALALSKFQKKGLLPRPVLNEQVAAVSVGILEGKPIVDLCYLEDKDAIVDLNVVGSDGGRLIEVQGTAENGAFSREELDSMLDAALQAVQTLTQIQRQTLQSVDIDLETLFAR